MIMRNSLGFFEQVFIQWDLEPIEKVTHQSYKRFIELNGFILEKFPAYR